MVNKISFLVVIGAIIQVWAIVFPQKQPNEGNAPDWYTDRYFDDKFRERVIENGFIPTKGIPYKIFGVGPWQPPMFTEQALLMPEETVLDFHDYERADASAKRISEKLEKIGINHAYLAYRSFRARAFKADLWRLMILWE